MAQKFIPSAHWYEPQQGFEVRLTALDLATDQDRVIRDLIWFVLRV
jgi:hypothetical protein